MNRLILRLAKRSPLPIQKLGTYHHRRSIIPFTQIQERHEQKQNKKPLPWLLSTTAGMTIDPTTTTTALETSLPAVLAMNEAILNTIHSAGLPWWGTILAGTLFLRTTLTLPIAVYQQRSMGKMINLAPMVQSWAETLKVEVAKQSNRAGWPYKQYQAELQKQYRKKVKEIYAHHGCARWKVLLLPWVQMPLFVSMSLTLRHMTAYPLPWYGKTAELPVAGLSEEGLAWFMDLTAVDPTMVIPVMIGAGNLINVELNAWYARGQQQSLTQKVMTNFFRVLSIAFIPIAANAPMSIGMYWLSSAWYSVAQNITFKIPAVRKTLKMPLINRKKALESIEAKKV